MELRCPFDCYVGVVPSAWQVASTILGIVGNKDVLEYVPFSVVLRSKSSMTVALVTL